jgi:hypothetical protein
MTGQKQVIMTPSNTNTNKLRITSYSIHAYEPKSKHMKEELYFLARRPASLL